MAVTQRGIRRGLVLAGGGAKGAYAFGCLVALNRLGYEFEVVSGTSVGGLNAALWARGSLSRGFSVWKKLSFDTIYPARMKSAGAPNSVIWLVGSIYVFMHLVSATVYGHKNPLTRYLVPLIVATYLSGGYIIFSILDTDPNEAFDIILPFFLVLYSIPLWLGLTRFQVKISAYFFVGWVIPAYLAVGPAIAEAVPFLALLVIVVTSIAVIPLGILIISWELGKAIDNTSQTAVFSASPLRQTVMDIIGSRSWKIPTIVTCAQRAEVVDTRSLIYGFVNAWVPNYVDVSKLPLERSADYLMASAALPFGMVSPVQIDGRCFVDGGVADNVPWTPLIEYELDEIVFILLEPFPDDAAAFSSLEMTESKWVTNLAQRRAQDQLVGSETDDELWESFIREKKALAAKVALLGRADMRFVYPGRAIGGFFSGTLKFDGTYAKDLIRAGMRDTFSKFAASAISH